MTEDVLVVDVGTSSVRAAVVHPDATVDHVHQAPIAVATPSPGLVEVDARRLADAVLETSAATLSDSGPVAGIGVAAQRATAVVWDRTTGEPVAPAIGWQDLRTVGICLALQADGIRLAPNMSATKYAAILDAVDPERTAARDLCAGTVDSWVAWTLAGGPRGPGGGLHVTDATNAAVTGLLAPGPDGRFDEWDPAVCEALGIGLELLPVIADSTGVLGPAAALPGAPPICALVGDQQASLVGQGCTLSGTAKATFGTGGMLDLCSGPAPPSHTNRGAAGTYPIVAWRAGGVCTWGTEAMMLTAGTCVDWLVDDLGIVGRAEDTATVAGACQDAGGVWFVPAFMGIGTPVWDFGARGTLLGLTRGTGRPELVRAVLEGIAHRGADLLEAAESDSGHSVKALRVDGGMSANEVFLQALADACGRTIEVSRELQATSLGAGMLAGIAVGVWGGTDELAAAYSPRRVLEPRLEVNGRKEWRSRWLEARDRATRTIPELSGIDF